MAGRTKRSAKPFFIVIGAAASVMDGAGKITTGLPRDFHAALTVSLRITRNKPGLLLRDLKTSVATVHTSVSRPKRHLYNYHHIRVADAVIVNRLKPPVGTEASCAAWFQGKRLNLLRPARCG